MTPLGIAYTANTMITTKTPGSNYSIRNDDASKLLVSNPPPSSPRHLHHQQELPSRLQSPWGTSVDNGNSSSNKYNNKSMVNTPKQQRKKHSSPSPAPFLSLQVERENCAVYVGNIPLDERAPCKNCCGEINDPNENKDASGNCPCAIELKAFLKDRINAAFKVPVEEIVIRTCRIFSVVTNVYSNDNDTAPVDADSECGESSLKSIAANANAKMGFRQRAGRRVHRAACVEFDDPKIAEYTLALKFTSFHFVGQLHNRSSLRMRRWTSQPPPPPPPTMSPKIWSPKQRHNPPAPRSKSVSPKISNIKRKQMPPPPPPRPNSVGPHISGRKQYQQQQRRNQLLVAPSTIIERSDSPLSSPVTFPNAMDEDGRVSPSCSSCLIHVGNIPADATPEDIREFFLGRMNKAFHGVIPPEIVRLGMRTIYLNSITGIKSRPRIDACLEFQDPKNAFRATQLKNRKWYVKDENGEEGFDEKQDGLGESGIGRKNSMPLLEIEIWDPTKHDINGFNFTNENNYKAIEANNNCVIGSVRRQVEGIEEHEIDLWEEGISEMKKIPAKLSPGTSPNPSPKSSPLQSQSRKTVEEAREYGFLVCTNPNKTPKCDHLFTIYPEQGEEIGCLLETKKARMCHGYAFRGKACRNHKKSRSGNSKCGPACPFAHIDFFEQLKDPHDILALLYYVENNDEVEFITGTGCTPQDYLQRQRIGEFKDEEEKSSIEFIQPNQHINLNLQSAEAIIQELQNSLLSARQELATSKQQLHNSKLARQSLLQQQPENPHRTKLQENDKDAMILSLQAEIGCLQVNVQETNHKWQTSTRLAENNQREYALLQERYQQNVVNRDGNARISSELLELEVTKLKEELKKSQAECQRLQLEKLNGNPTTDDKELEDSWPELNMLDSFLQSSIPTLMQMTDGNIDETQQPRLTDLLPKPRLTDIPIDCTSSRLNPYKAVVDCKPILPIMSPLSSPIASTKKKVVQNEDTIRSEIGYLVSCYGNQVFINNNGASTVVTRFLKLPMTLCKGRDIDVALVLTIPPDYPWNGIVKVESDSRLTSHFGADLQYRKIVSESISGLLNMCRWEAEACQGKPHVLMSIMRSAERWVQNDWKVIQKKNWTIEYDSNEDSHSSSQTST